MSLMGGACNNFICPPQSAGDVQLLVRTQIVLNHVFTRTADMKQPAFVLGCGSSVPDGDEGGEDGFNDGGAELHHLRLWQVLILQPLLLFFFPMRGLMLGCHFRFPGSEINNNFTMFELLYPSNQSGRSYFDICYQL